MREINVLPEFNRGVISIKDIPVFQHDTSLQDQLGKSISEGEAIRLFEAMLYIRVFEEMIIRLKSGKFVPQEGFNLLVPHIFQSARRPLPQVQWPPSIPMIT